MSDFNVYKNMPFEQLVEDSEFRKWIFSPSSYHNKFWKEFLIAHPEHKDTVMEAKQFLSSSKLYFETNDKSNDEIEASLNKIIEHTKSPANKKSKTRTKRLQLNKKMAIAASLALLIIAGFWYKMAIANHTQSYATDYAEWKTIELPDASTVQLNANSKLELSDDWSNEATRKVWLEGEAFFDVKKKLETETKFQVIVDKLVIEVLGTKFNVQNRGEQTEVYLQEGKIKLKMNGKEEHVSPGELVVYSSKEKSIIHRNTIEDESYASWKKGSLQMESSVREIFKKIEEIYGVKIEVMDETILDEVRKIGVPLKDLEIVIPILEISLEAEIIKDGNKLTLKNN